jgi:hypothetical protein
LQEQIIAGEISYQDALRDCTIEGQVEINEPENDYSPRILGAAWGWVTQRVQQSLHAIGSPAWEYYESCETTEDFLLGRCGRDEPTSEDFDTDDEQLACLGAPNTTLTPPNGSTFAERKAYLAAEIQDLAQQNNIEPELLWGILNIEGSPYLRAVLNGETIRCAELLNTCGAVGPMQIIHSECVEQTGVCRNANVNYLSTQLDRSGEDLCSLEGSVSFAAGEFLSSSSGETAEQRAGRYHGFPEASSNGAQNCGGPVDGCNGLNYCQCAAYGFENDFQDALQQYRQIVGDQVQ